MARPDNPHSRLVFWLKIALPLVALALLSSMFLLARSPQRAAPPPVSPDELAALIREQRLRNPEYAGVTEDGAALRVSADLARAPGGGSAGEAAPSEASAEGVAADYALPDGRHITILAGQALMDRAGGLLRMAGGVEIVTSTAWRLTTQALQAAMDRTRLMSDGTVEAEAPFGALTGGRMEIRREGESYLLLFTDGVKLIYQPRRQE